MRSKWLEAAEYICKQDIVVFTESKLDDKVTSGSLDISGYHLVRQDRNSNGGGVATFIKDVLRPVDLVDIQNKYVKLGIEVTVTAVSIHKTARQTIVLGIYRPPNSKAAWFDVFNDLLMDVIALGPLIILGDLNADLLSPAAPTTASLLNSIALSNTLIHSTFPTRITDTSSSALDLISVSRELVCSSYKAGSLAASDHLPVEAVVQGRGIGKPTPIAKRNFRKINQDTLKSRLANIQLDAEVNAPDVLLNTWQSAVISILDDVAPMRLCPVRRTRSPWINNDIRNLITQRDKISRQLKSAKRSLELHNRFKVLRKQIKSRLRAASKSYGQNLLKDNCRKNAWKFIRQATFTVTKDKQTLTDCSALNNFFANTVTSLHAADLTCPSTCDRVDGFTIQHLCTADTRRLLTGIAVNTASGPDGLPGHLLKSTAWEIAPNVTRIINSSLSTGIVPIAWKEANVTAIWKKKGSKSDPANYRPISILPILARLTEKAVATQLSYYCSLQHAIPVEQFGFRAKSSCEIALVSALDSWMQAVDKGNMVGALLIDLSKAFDAVPHQQLLNELLVLGCNRSALEWFSSYLTDRKQRVVAADALTDWRKITRGVPQGSCLSPLLFNIFVRELPKNVTLPTVQFADDITHAAVEKDPELLADKLTESFHQTKLFCERQGLNINTPKTQLIVFHANGKKLPQDFSITLDGNCIQPTSSVKLLGVTLDERLTFKAHIDSTVVKCNGILGALARAAPSLSRDLLRLAFVALVRSHLEYASATFASCAATHLAKLDMVQRKGARIICQVRRDTHAAPLLEMLQLESLDSRRDTHLIKIVHDILRGSCHPALNDMFIAERDGSVTAAESTLPRTKMGSRRFSVVAAAKYNTQLAEKLGIKKWWSRDKIGPAPTIAAGHVAGVD